MGFRGPLQKGGQDKERKRRKEEGRGGMPGERPVKEPSFIASRSRP